MAALTPPEKPYEAYLSIPGTDGVKTQHKATLLRIYSSRYSIAESRDRLKRVSGFSRHETTAVTLHPDDARPGEPTFETEDPAAILVCSNGFVWLAVVLMAGITSGPRQVQTLPTRLLTEPNVRVRVQLMELVPTTRPPGPESDEGD